MHIHLDFIQEYVRPVSLPLRATSGNGFLSHITYDKLTKVLHVDIDLGIFSA